MTATLGVIAWQELDAQGDFFDGMWPVFTGSPHDTDLDMNDFMVLDNPWNAFTEDFKAELRALGYGDALLPRGMGNSDTAFYALDMSEYHDHDIVRIALIDAPYDTKE